MVIPQDIQAILEVTHFPLADVVVYLLFILEVTTARKVLPHPQWIKASMCNLLNKGLFI
jgi:hypothetical protein